MKNDELLHKWVNGDLTAKELETFKLRPEYESLSELYEKTDHLTVPKFDEDEMLGEIMASNKNAVSPPRQAVTRSLPVWIRYAAAAAILLLGGFFLWPDSDMITYQASAGEQKEGELPDGSTFVLNAGSSLVYNKEDWEDSRSLNLEGEAFFEVEKGALFQVKTTNGLVEVLGTKFNVWSRKQILEVKCQSGKVAVSSSDGDDQQILIANEGVRIVEGVLSPKWEEPTNEKPSWLAGISNFRRVPLSIVLDELERQFDVEIDAGQVNINDIISCNFQHGNLELALKTCLSSMGFKYKMQGKRKLVLIR